MLLLTKNFLTLSHFQAGYVLVTSQMHTHGPVSPLCWLITLEVSNASTVPCGAAPAAQVPLLKQSAAKK